MIIYLLRKTVATSSVVRLCMYLVDFQWGTVPLKIYKVHTHTHVYILNGIKDLNFKLILLYWINTQQCNI